MTDRGMNVQNVERQEKPLDILRITALTVARRWQARQVAQPASLTAQMLVPVEQDEQLTMKRVRTI